jgi:DNA polymerase-3 subunit delta
VSAARTLPFLAPRRVVVYRDIEKSGFTPAKAVVLHTYLEDPSPAATLVVTTEEDNAGKSWKTRLSKSCEVVEFKPLRGKALEAAVREAAKERGVSMGREAVERLIEAVGSDMQRLTQEVEKLALAVGPGGGVGVEEVGLLVCGYAHHTVFSLAQAVCRRDLAGSLALLDGVPLGVTEIMGLMGMLAKRMSTLWYLAGKVSEVPASFRVQGWQLKDLRREASAFSRKELEGFLDDLLFMDRAMKTSANPPETLLGKFVRDVCARSGAATR